MSMEGESPSTRRHLHGILSKYAEIISYERGDIVVQGGAYGDAMYFILEGSVTVILDKKEQKREGGLPSTQKHASKPQKRVPRILSAWGNLLTRLQDKLSQRIESYSDAEIADVLARHSSVQIEPSMQGAIGEIAVLAGTRYSRMIFVEQSATLLKLSAAGARRLVEVSATFNDFVARRRQFVWWPEIAGELKFFKSLPQAVTDKFFALDVEHLGVAGRETVVVAEGDYMDHAVLVMSGFGRVTSTLNGRDVNVGFVKRGDVFGLAALASAHSAGRSAVSPGNLKAEGKMVVSYIPSRYAIEHIMPLVSREDTLKIDPAAVFEYGTAHRAGSGFGEKAEQFADFLASHLFNNGQQAMLIDQSRCVGCDACVRACTDAHGGVPRFTRTGPSFDGYSVINSCMHCAEAFCLSSCPTGAIIRSIASGAVIVEESRCIGCGACASACPYDNIHMVERDKKKARADEQPLMVATKCDLCEGGSGPACVQACPHEAIARVNLSDREVIRHISQPHPLPIMMEKSARD